MKLRNLAVAAVAAVVAIGGASTAQASSSPSKDFHTYTNAKAASYPSKCTASYSYGAARGCWVADGEKFYVTDLKADGRRVGIHFTVIRSDWHGYIAEGVCYSTLGNGKTGVCDYSFAEHQIVQFVVGTCDASEDFADCSDSKAWIWWDWHPSDPITTRS